MDRKSLLIMVVSLLFLAAWFPFTNWMYPPIPAPRNTNVVTSASAQLTNTVGTATTNGTNIATATGVATNGTNQVAAPSAVQPPREEQTIAIENENARYVFTSIGGGLKTVELKKYPAVVGRDKKKVPNSGNITLNDKAPAPLMGILENGDTSTLRAFTLTRTGDVVRAETPLDGGMHLIKEFRLSTNYLLKATVRYENRGAQPLSIPERELVIGTATPISRHDESQHLGLQWYDGEDTEKVNESWFANYRMGCGMFGGDPRTLYRAGQSNIFWAAVNNQFFTIIGVPETPGAQVASRRINLPQPSIEERSKDPGVFSNPFGYQTALVMPATVMPANTQLEHRLDIFAGPKEFKTLQLLPRNMDLVMGFGGFFGFFAKALLISMNGLHAIGMAYGVAIIAITVIIKLLFWPLTNASTRSMKRMAALQPQMKAIQEKYKEDPRKMNMKMMEFMKEHKVSPLGGCLPLLLQIPVFFGFYTMLQSAIELRGASFLWAWDLSQPDTIAYLAGFPLNILPLLMGATMLWQARLTPPAPGMDPAQQAIMRYMPLMMVFFLYNFSAGLTLYWTVQNLLSIAQMKLTRAGDEKAQAAGPGAKPGVPVAPVTIPKKKK